MIYTIDANKKATTFFENALKEAGFVSGFEEDYDGKTPFWPVYVRDSNRKTSQYLVYNVLGDENVQYMDGLPFMKRVDISLVLYTRTRYDAEELIDDIEKSLLNKTNMRVTFEFDGVVYDEGASMFAHSCVIGVWVT